MARLLIYDAYENKVYTYANLNENDPMPYSTGTTLRVREFRGKSGSPVLWTTIAAMEASTRSAQALLDLPETGVADAETWTAVEALSLQLAAVSPNPDRDAGQADVYPGRAMKEGSVGPDVGQIEQWLNGRYMRICGEDYVTENFRFGPKETEGVRAAQERADLLVTGTVNEETWAALRAQSCECEEG